MSPKIIFDTSAINALRNAGAAAEPLLRGLTCGFEVIVTGMCVEELIATPTATDREELLRRLDWLLRSAQCIWPPHEIIRRLISSHCSNSSEFDWKKVGVRARAYENAILRRDLDDTLCANQRNHHFDAEKDFEKLWRPLRPKLDMILAKEPSKRPKNYRKAVAIVEIEGGFLWGLGQRLYKYISKKEPTESDIKSFMDVCPPFRAACYGLIMAWYNWSLRDLRAQKSTAGRNDLMMAAYLPYCDLFISNDRSQRENLREIASEAKVECAILSFDEFHQGLLLGA